MHLASGCFVPVAGSASPVQPCHASHVQPAFGLQQSDPQRFPDAPSSAEAPRVGTKRQLAGSDVPLRARMISTEQCRSVLGMRTFSLLREAIKQQQDVFVEQLWDLHRLARAQGRQSMHTSAEAALGLQQDKVGAASGIFSRERQGQVHARTCASILSLATLPASLRREPPASAVAAGEQQAAPSQVPQPATKVARPESGPSHASSDHASVTPTSAGGGNMSAQPLCREPAKNFSTLFSQAQPAFAGMQFRASDLFDVVAVSCACVQVYLWR
jgi:hypothetical protein